MIKSSPVLLPLQSFLKRTVSLLPITFFFVFFFFSCNGSSKPPIEEAIKAKLLAQGYSLISYNIESLKSLGDYHIVRYSAVVKTEKSEKIEKKDSIFFDKTGDGIWVYR